MVLSTKTVPTETLNAPIVGATSLHTLEDLKARRSAEVDFKLARHVLETHLRDDMADPGAAIKTWLFPQVLEIAAHWRKECVTCQDDMFPQILFWAQYCTEAGEKIYRSLAAGAKGEKRIKPILFPYDTEGTTRYVDFDTARPTYATDARYQPDLARGGRHRKLGTEGGADAGIDGARSISRTICTWVHYSVYVRWRAAAVCAGFRGADGDDLNMILEVTGEKKPDKEAKGFDGEEPVGACDQ